MYRNNQRQLQFEDFSLPFGGKLRSDNRWVKLAKFIPWEEFEPDYAKALASTDKGPPAMSVRVALGTLIIKERLGSSDEETVEQLSENPYLQYFLGFQIVQARTSLRSIHAGPFSKTTEHGPCLQDGGRQGSCHLHRS